MSPFGYVCRVPVVVRNVAADEFALAGEIVVSAYRTLGDEGDEWYERELRDVSGRVASSEVLVAEDDGRVIGCLTFVDGLGELSEVADPDAATIRMLGVAEAARGRGIGELLVRECIERLAPPDGDAFGSTLARQ